MGQMKVSDKKKYDRAWQSYYTAVKDLIIGLDTIIELSDNELRVDEINQLSTSISKVAKVVIRICENHMLYADEDI